ncbi:cytochrome P450 [Macrolepiota fuliginosa MF-IS2]|uniref:Cytochrome P450 n=1 Tax=Macrolepiota fuliginosa MF-IS2 TaxID=1400762 RepID=A0A9P5X305_9AGAR|nr:cytochrome P450 [Macrolepiota fuliginosa MF-IS2]
MPLGLFSPFSSQLITAATGLTFIFLFHYVLRTRQRRSLLRAAMPPGPRLGWLGFGDNRHDVPSSQPWKEYARWHQEFGPIISAVLGNTNIVVLGTLKAATDLLEKRGSIYSSRARNIIGGEILSRHMRGVGMPYGPKWRNWRSLVHSGLSVEASRSYKPLQSLEARIFLRGVMDEHNPDLYPLHVRRFALSVVTSVGYGKRVNTLQDDIVLENIEIDHYFLRAMSGYSIVEYWPILLHLPEYLQWFRWIPEKMRLRDTRIYTHFLAEVRKRVENGTAMPCIAVCGLEKQKEWGLSDTELAYACSAPWQAGGSSTTALIEVFIMAMLLFPGVMYKAQEEIDSVIGRLRQPEFQDLDDLPYTHALVKEIQRWRPILPLAVAHSNVYADEYEGCFIPSGSTVYANVYMMARDPEMFPDPDAFKPERFLGPHAIPTFTAGFGFGRRQCAGMHIAVNSVFILVSKLLWAFNIDPNIDPLTGHPVFPNPDDMEGELVVRPKKLNYILTPRGDRDQTRNVILAEAEHAETEALAWTA